MVPTVERGVAASGLLLDGDDRREAENEIHVGLGHLGDEAFGKAGERFQITPLSFRVDGVEGQAGLTGAGESGDDDEFCRAVIRARRS